MTNLIFPYMTLSGDISLKIAGGSLDDKQFPKNPFAPDRSLVDLSDVGKSDWHVVSLKVELNASADEIDEFEKEHSPVSAIIVVHCSRANLRNTFPLSRDEGGSGRWFGEIELMRCCYAGRTKMEGVISGTVDGIDHRCLGRSAPWNIDFDEADHSPLSGALRVQWVDFDQPGDYAFLKEYADQPFYTDLVDDRPTVFLNRAERFRGLDALLDDRKRNLAWDRALHNAERVSIARSVWMAMLNAAIASIERGDEGDDPDWPEQDWKRQVLQKLLPRVYPDKSDKEALREALANWNSKHGAGQLESRAQAEIGKIIKADRLLRLTLASLSQDLSATASESERET
jgi:hypothetical protein